MIEEQQKLRERYKTYLKETGVNQKFICNKLLINESLTSRWKNGKLYLPQSDFVSLNEYITKAGY